MVPMWSKLDGDVRGSLGDILEAAEAVKIEVDLVSGTTPLSGMSGLVGIFEVGW